MVALEDKHEGGFKLFLTLKSNCKLRLVVFSDRVWTICTAGNLNVFFLLLTVMDFIKGKCTVNFLLIYFSGYSSYIQFCLQMIFRYHRTQSIYPNMTLICQVFKKKNILKYLVSINHYELNFKPRILNMENILHQWKGREISLWKANYSVELSGPFPLPNINQCYLCSQFHNK